VQSTKFELLISGDTARRFGFKVPASLLAIADGIIE
jgi:hypothetical protein